MVEMMKIFFTSFKFLNGKYVINSAETIKKKANRKLTKKLEKENGCCCLTVIQLFGYLPIENTVILLRKAAGRQKIARFVEPNVLDNLQ